MAVEAKAAMELMARAVVAATAPGELVSAVAAVAGQGSARQG